MRVPRVRFTIAGLMALILGSGLTLWRLDAARRARNPSIAEQQALASYKQATLVREVAEYAVREFEFGEPARSFSGPLRLDFRGEIPLATTDSDRLARGTFAFSALSDRERASWKKQLDSLKADVVKARADEQAKLQTYRSEQAKRMRIFGF